MATITIDGKEYDSEKISQEARVQIANLRFVDRELKLLGSRAAALQTARNAYLMALKKSLNESK